MNEVKSKGFDDLEKDEHMITCWNEDQLVGRVPIIIGNACYEVNFDEDQPTYLHNYILSNGWIVEGKVNRVENEDGEDLIDWV